MAASTRQAHLISTDADLRQRMVDIAKALGLSLAVHDSADAYRDAGAPGGCCLVADGEVADIEVLRSWSAVGPIPIIMITHPDDVSMAVRSIRHGAHDVLEKPVSAGVLLATLNRVLADRTAV